METLLLSVKLSALTSVILLPFALLLARWLAFTKSFARLIVEPLILLPLVLPPTVAGFIFLVAFGDGTTLGTVFNDILHLPLVFTFEGILVVSLLINIPFFTQPVQRAFESIPESKIETAVCCGLEGFKRFRIIELSYLIPGVLTGFMLTFAHTMGEFGVVLMVGGNIPGETRTASVSIYNLLQAFRMDEAMNLSLALLGIAFLLLFLIYLLALTSGKLQRK